ncbi:hypothetical protein FOVSG1_002463 [Fusarium oxysporum f. sp. vasinfectum]
MESPQVLKATENPVLIANAVTVYVYSQPIGRQSQDSNIELKRLSTSPIIRQPLCLAATRTLRTNTKTQQRSLGALTEALDFEN